MQLHPFSSLRSGGPSALVSRTARQPKRTVFAPAPCATPKIPWRWIRTVHF
jgi:hypothetical protein